MKSLEYIEINNAAQCISISSDNSEKPILLYLHGGPGDAAIPLVEKYNKNLRDSFSVVVLEQRGSGKSYYQFTEKDNIEIGTFVDDIHALTLLLLKRFGHKKLYLLGHSWGSVLGINFIKRYPELVHAYIGCGQVVNMKKSSQTAYEFALHRNEEKQNNKVLSKLKLIDYTYQQNS